MRLFINLLFLFSFVFTYLDAAAAPGNSSKSGGWDNAFSNGSTLIPLVHFGQKSYYFAIYFSATYLEADQFCRDIHMDLVRVQSAEENDYLYKYVQESTKDDHFWTAGSKLLDKRNWIWMSTGEVVEYTNWGSTQPDNPNTELCLELWLTKNKGLYFNDRGCHEKYSFICEKDKRRQQVVHDEKDPHSLSLFQNPNVSPNINLLHFEGKSYYFGTYFKATYLQATQFCQMINMQLVSITSEPENSRLHKYIRDTNAGDYFWSSGSKAIDGKTWVWISTGRNVEYTNWQANQPDSTTDRCIQLVEYKEKGLFWDDTGCDNLLYFICDTSENVWYSRPVSSPARSGSGSNNEVESTEKYPDNPSLPETTVNGKRYRVSKTKESQEAASETCRQYDMELVSIQDKKKNDVITKLIQNSGNSNGSGAYYWTSGTLSNGHWVWGDQEPVTYTNWAAKEPNNANKKEFCLHLFLNGQWNDQACDRELYFVCESLNDGHQKHCASQPVVNVYVNNGQCSSVKNGTVTETKQVASSRDGQGYNVEVNNNVEGCCTSTTNKVPAK